MQINDKWLLLQHWNVLKIETNLKTTISVYVEYLKCLFITFFKGKYHKMLGFSQCSPLIHII